ncbi:MAG: hypothetical protein ACFFBD_12310 [Candidatus Hodarchaeota archaeon]
MYESKLSLLNEKVLSFLRILAIVIVLIIPIYMVLSIILSFISIFTGFSIFLGFSFEFLLLLLMVGCGIFLVLYDIRRAYCSK